MEPKRAFFGVRALVAACALFTFAGESDAQVFVGLPNDESKPIVLSNFESDATPVLLIAADPAPGAPPAARATAPVGPSAALPYAAVVAEIAKEVGLPAAVIRAVIKQESNFDPKAVSTKGAMGLMQLRPETAGRFGVHDPFDPRENIRAGALYLRWLSNVFDDRLDLVLAAYNAGEQTVIRAGRRVPEFAETKSYVARILASLQCNSLAACALIAAGS